MEYYAQKYYLVFKENHCFRNAGKTTEINVPDKKSNGLSFKNNCETGSDATSANRKILRDIILELEIGRRFMLDEMLAWNERWIETRIL